MAQRFPSAPLPSSRIRQCIARGAWPGRLAGAILVLLAAASCSVLPPSMKEKPDAASPAFARPKGPQADFGPSREVPPASGGGATSQPTAKVYKGTGEFLNPRPPAPAAPPGPEEASLNFEALDVREVAKVILGDYLKQSYTVHPAVQGTVTFRTVKPIPLKDLLPTLEMLLRQNNAAVVKEEGIYKVLPINMVRGSITPQLGGYERPIPPGFSVLVVPLKYVGAREMARILEPFAPPDSVRVDEVRNLVIMAGDQRELRHLVETVELFDVDWLSGYSVGLFPIRSADVKSLMADLDKVFGNAAQSPLAGIVRVIPIERLNSLLVVTTQQKYLEMARTWIDRIDQAGTTSGGTRFYVYQVKNGKAESLAQLIGDLFSTRRTTVSGPTLSPGSRPAQLSSSTFGQITPPSQAAAPTGPASATFSMPGANGMTSSEVRVIADKDTNSLLILAAPADYETIENALRQLDVVPRQVLVEVMLAEVTLTDNLSLGLEYYIHTRNNTSGSLNLGGLGTGGPTGAVPAINGLQLINFSGNEVRAVLNALGQDGKARILASPQIMVLDNQKAQIKVGDRISVQTQTQTGVSTGTGVLNSFQYLETGILLAVTPRINSGGLVTLDVNQEVSVPDASSTSPNNPNPTVNSRSAQTSVVVASGESIVLGGLINEQTTTGTAGIPLLSKIPVLGALFGSQSYNRKRTELVLIITPRIVSDSVQAREATLELRRKLPALESLLPKPKDLPPAPPEAAPRGK
ncbi:MAG TPA: type II secretion system secretin GspD [Usitatibacter sp.]|jgi:general secretion pathway protein D